MKPIHPGQILHDDFLLPLGISAYRLAHEIDVPVNRITAIINEQRAITPATSLLLGQYFDVPDEFWLHIQTRYDIECAKVVLKKKLKTITHASL